MPIRFEIDTAGRRVLATAVPPVTDSDVIRISWPWPPIRSTKLAIVVTAQIPQSIARMLAEYLSDIIDVRTFSSVDDATTWLGVCVASPEGGGIGE